MKEKLKYISGVCFALFALVVFVHEVQARPVVADAFPRKIDIDHKFKGLDVLVYGARNDAGSIVIVVRGPKKDYLLRKKGKVAGIWTNIYTKEIKDLYSLYSISTMRNLEDLNNNSLLKSLGIGLNSMNYQVVNNYGKESLDPEMVKSEANQLMQQKGLYTGSDNEILFWGETLFRSFIKFPKNIIRGVYNIDIYLFNDGLLNSYQTLPIIVEQVGVEAFLHDFAYNHSLFYGVISVLIALFMGWLASVLFGRR